MKPTSTEAAICCMIVSNPSGGMQPHGWQKRVNDLIRAQDQELTTLRAERDALQQAQTYSYIGKDMKTVKAVDLENERDALRASEAADSLDKEMIRNIRTRIAALTPTADKE